MFRQTITRQARLFSTSVRVRKSAVDSAKETLQSVDKTISQQAVKGIEGAGGSYLSPYGHGVLALTIAIRTRRPVSKRGRWHELW